VKFRVAHLLQGFVATFHREGLGVHRVSSATSTGTGSKQHALVAQAQSPQNLTFDGNSRLGVGNRRGSANMAWNAAMPSALRPVRCQMKASRIRAAAGCTAAPKRASIFARAVSTVGFGV
jgi:hypothetical protein